MRRDRIRRPIPFAPRLLAPVHRPANLSLAACFTRRTFASLSANESPSFVVPLFPLAHPFGVFAPGETLFAATLAARAFGAHTCERRDEPRGRFFHTHWTGAGGRVASSTYTV
jgi:hypothetical protein